ncbi:MAG: choice-of-anchor D domain-containing protein [Anaeromyxobacter sp.]|nr:choice-of-anchor D domain-containing protein [Anaeromyxobacter sp.]
MSRTARTHHHHPGSSAGPPLGRGLVAVLTAALLAGTPACRQAPPQAPAPARQEAVAPVGQGFTLNASDLRFIRQQIRIAEAHAAGGQLFGPGPDQVHDVRLPFGLRTVDGTFNNLVPGQEDFGAADQAFPRLAPADFRAAEAGTSYAQKKGLVQDSQPRLVSNLVVDQTPANPAALAAAGAGALPDFSGTLFIPNVAPDVGLSAPYNSMFTLFGQFFDHGLDLVTKGGGTVFVPLQPDDPLFVPGSPTNFMVLTRATNRPGPDGVIGDDPATPADESADDVQEAMNTTTPFVDQNQTYTSHPAHQVFLRAYRLDGAGRPVATGKLLDGAIAGNIGSWSEVKAQAAALLGLALSDADVTDVPLLATDPYGRFLRGPSGFPQVVFPGNVLVEGNPAAPVSVAGAVRTGHAFLDDIAHHAAPVGDHDGNPATPRRALLPDADPGTADDLDPATYDDELLGAHFVTGDGRGNENIGLTMVHSVFHAEHNRLADDVHRQIGLLLTTAEAADWAAVNPASGWDHGERLFQAARFVTEMEYQHLVFEEFARKVQPQVNLFAGYHTEIDPAISAEFAHTVYRFGHSMLTEVVARVNADGTPNDLSLLDAFLNPRAFNDGGPAGTLTAEQAVGSIVRGMTRQVGNELDEFVTEALRDRLLGLPLDLATINLARGRSEGVPRLNDARRQFFAATINSALAPYQSWADLGDGLRHRLSLANFVAAYGTHPSISGDLAARRAAAALLVAADPADPATPADAFDFMVGAGAWAAVGGRSPTGLEDVDFWVGGLAEKQAPFGGLLGSTFNHVFETQLERLQDGDRLYYLTRTAGLNLLVQLEGNSFAELVMRNSDATSLPADVFSRPDFLFDLAALGASGPILDDPATPDDESLMADLRRLPDGTVRYTGPAHVIWAGTDDPAVVDRISSSEGDDTLRGNGGRDVMEGGSGNDQFIGGEGDDILTDAFGDDVLKGGHGDDAISSGPGFDLNMGGLGNDFVVGGSDPTETFGGPGDDFIFAGDSTDTVFGDDGDDWIEGGGQADLLQGDNGAPFQNDPNAPGHDVIIGDGGDDDYDAEGGDDIMVAGPGVERSEGMLGFDWVTHKNDPQPADADLFRLGLLPPDQDALRDRFDLVEGLSGWRFADLLRGDDGDATTMVGHELDAAGIARIQGLSAVLGEASAFTGGNVLLGGAGSDLLEGRGGDDVIDGDAWLDVSIRAPDLSTPDPTDSRLVDGMAAVRADVFSGRLHPGELSIVRRILTAGAGPADVDTAVYSGARAEYLVARNADGTVTVDHQGGLDGRDTLRNVELLAFTDGTIPVPVNSLASGTVTLSSLTPVEGQLLVATSTVADADGIDAATFRLVWQVETAPGLFAEVAVGDTFRPDDPVAGRRLRVVATFLDLAAVPAQESVASSITAAVTAVNDPPTGAPQLSDTTPSVGAPLSALTAGLADADGLGPFTYQWQADRVNIAGAAARAVGFTPTAAQLGRQLTVVVTWTDGQGFTQAVASPASAAVTPAAGPIASVVAAFDFGRRRVNTTTLGQLTVTNPGSAPLVISAVTSSGAPFVTPSLGTCAAPLAPGRTCRVTVTFRPTALGAFAGTLTLTSNAINSPTQVALTGLVR